jgi:hypothetical protein
LFTKNHYMAMELTIGIDLCERCLCQWQNQIDNYIKGNSTQV